MTAKITLKSLFPFPTRTKTGHQNFAQVGRAFQTCHPCRSAPNPCRSSLSTLSNSFITCFTGALCRPHDSEGMSFPSSVTQWIACAHDRYCVSPHPSSKLLSPWGSEGFKNYPFPWTSPTPCSPGHHRQRKTILELPKPSTETSVCPPGSIPALKGQSTIAALSRQAVSLLLALSQH